MLSEPLEPYALCVAFALILEPRFLFIVLAEQWTSLVRSYPNSVVNIQVSF